MPQDGSYDPKRDHDHDDERLSITSERNGQETKNADQSHLKAGSQSAQGLCLLTLLTAQGVLQTVISLEQVRERTYCKGLNNVIAGDRHAIYIRCDVDDASPLASLDACV